MDHDVLSIKNPSECHAPLHLHKKTDILSGVKSGHLIWRLTNPKGNADTERVIRTIKENLVWTREFDSIDAFRSELEKWKKAYNEDYPHYSSLGYMTPYEYERWFNAAAA